MSDATCLHLAQTCTAVHGDHTCGPDGVTGERILEWTCDTCGETRQEQVS